MMPFGVLFSLRHYDMVSRIHNCPFFPLFSFSYLTLPVLGLKSRTWKPISLDFWSCVRQKADYNLCLIAKILFQVADRLFSIVFIGKIVIYPVVKIHAYFFVFSRGLRQKNLKFISFDLS